jgi:hypothetical protein
MKYCNLIIVVAFIALVSFHSFYTGYSSYNSFYNKTGYPPLNKILRRIDDNLLIDFVSTYTGLNTGYGFFSPNVASDCLMVIVSKDSVSGKSRKYLSTDLLNTKEGKMRFSNLNNLFLKMSIDSTELKNEYKELKEEMLLLILGQISSYIENERSNQSIELQVYLYHFPFLDQFPNTQPVLIPICQYGKAEK